MQSFKEHLNEAKLSTFDIWKKSTKGKLIRVETTLGNDELDAFLSDNRNIKKFPSLIVKRADGVTVVYDSDGRQFNKVKTGKFKDIQKFVA